MTVAIVLGIPLAIVAIVWLFYTSTVTTDLSVSGDALVSANGRTVSVTAGALCGDTITVTADEQPASVAITVHDTHPRTRMCSGMPGFGVYHVGLTQPLGRRQLLDGATGRPLLRFDAAAIAIPAYIPPGYTFRYDAPDAANLLAFGYLPIPPDALCSQLYTSGDDLLVISQGGTLLANPAVKARRVTVHGHPALEFPGEITWTEGGQRFTVSARDLPASALLAVADSVPARSA